MKSRPTGMGMNWSPPKHRNYFEPTWKSKQLLEDLTGSPIQGYRAPGFTITRETLWALLILAEEGYTYDSSLVPIRHEHCGLLDPTPGTI